MSHLGRPQWRGRDCRCAQVIGFEYRCHHYYWELAEWWDRLAIGAVIVSVVAWVASFVLMAVGL